jgi:electron transport complex protein RnfG
VLDYAQEKTQKNPKTNYQYYQCLDKQGNVKGYIYTAAADGYSGPVKVLVGINKKAIIQGIVVLQQSETPGLGARVNEIANNKYFWQIAQKKIKTQSPIPWFWQQFKGLSLKQKIKVAKEKEYKDLKPKARQKLTSRNAVSAITGATITSKTVVKAVSKGYKKLPKNLK